MSCFFVGDMMEAHEAGMELAQAVLNDAQYRTSFSCTMHSTRKF